MIVETKNEIDTLLIIYQKRSKLGAAYIMTKKTPEERLKQLEERKAQIEKKLRQEREAITRAKRREHAKILNRNRKDDTRRKILIGAAMLKKIEDGSWNKDRMLALMDRFLDRDRDRELFGLETDHIED